MGNIHHSLRCHKKDRNSPTIPVLVTIPLKKFLIIVQLLLIKIEFQVFVQFVIYL